MPPKPLAGCFQCRVSKKLCPMTAQDGVCGYCRVKGWQCQGYGEAVPGWTKDRAFINQVRETLMNPADPLPVLAGTSGGAAMVTGTLPPCAYEGGSGGRRHRVMPVSDQVFHQQTAPSSVQQGSLPSIDPNTVENAALRLHLHRSLSILCPQHQPTTEEITSVILLLQHMGWSKFPQ
ncbi:uncharacterized protein EI90DRAFT_2056337 [Cantharellus anzutake]|uniref:uncharacterized protein n=1 Tax=Cantharellus anzutake TaxID=1750568 RepID=UPI00190582E7|nr:uncharacterized protein EI90DRAFT_2056337 [Cantharellus anzutake]KAF8340379.1 hypothetical protein EI90DRAFT_2056337 [Cantharellus anzutake]